MSFDSIVGYTYAADTYCPGCIVDKLTNGNGGNIGESTEERLDRIAQHDGIDRMDEHSFDSGEFPKVILSINVHSGDSPDYCGRCHELLAPYECSICGDEHRESAHGDPLVQRDTGRDTLTGNVRTFVSDASALVSDKPGADYVSAYVRLSKLSAEYDQLTDDQRDEYAPEYLDDIDAILTDAGYVPLTDSYQGTWCVYNPTASDVESPVA
jgi:hypothetical protein